MTNAVVSDEDVIRAGIAYCLAKRKNDYHVPGMRAALEGFARDFIKRHATAQTHGEGEPSTAKLAVTDEMRKRAFAAWKKVETDPVGGVERVIDIILEAALQEKR
jgi:hypothetical protein